MPPGIFKVKLNNGLEMPVLGLSTGQVCLFSLKIFIYLQAVENRVFIETDLKHFKSFEM
jgi:hypothetical protein